MHQLPVLFPLSQQAMPALPPHRPTNRTFHPAPLRRAATLNPSNQPPCLQRYPLAISHHTLSNLLSTRIASAYQPWQANTRTIPPRNPSHYPMILTRSPFPNYPRPPTPVQPLVGVGLAKQPAGPQCIRHAPVPVPPSLACTVPVRTSHPVIQAWEACPMPAPGTSHPTCRRPRTRFIGAPHRRISQTMA